MSWPLRYSLALKHHTNRPVEGSCFQSLALFCSTEIMWSHSETDTVEALSSQYCSAAWSVEEAAPGIQKKLLRFTCFMIGFFPCALISCIRLKHCTQASSKMTLKVQRWVRILGPHKPNLWLCYVGTVIILDRTQNVKG